jgi:hypothetical protein
MTFKELFNQNLITTPNDDYRFALGLPGVEGAVNIQYSVFVDLITTLAGITDWSAKVYTNRAIVLYNNQLYILSDSVSLPYSSTNFTTELAAGDWLQLTFELSQSSGNGTTILMSQDAITNLLNSKVDIVLGKGLSTNDFTNAYKTKLDSLNEHYKGKYVSLAALQAAYPTASDGDYAIVDSGVGVDAKEYLWDQDDLSWVLGGGSTIVVDLSIVDGSTNAVSGNAVYDALVLKANLISPNFSGTPTAPTATAGTNTSQIATTEFVTTAVNNIGKEYQILFFGETTGFLSFASTLSLNTSNNYAKQNIQSFIITPYPSGSTINIVTGGNWNTLPINIPSGVYTWSATYTLATSQGVLHFKLV